MNPILILGCFALMVVLYLIYESIKWGSEEHRWQEWFFKGSATAMSAVLAGYGYLAQSTPVHLLVLIGLCVCVLADVILDKFFLAGTLLFGAAHICYCASMLLSARPGIVNLIVFLALAGGTALLYPQLKKLSGDKNALPYAVYALLISALLALAVTQKPWIMAGALLFVVSDCMLLFRIVKKIPSRLFDYVCLGCYYLAQFLIAVSTLF